MSISKHDTLSSVTISITDCPHSTPTWTNEGKLVIRNFNIKNGRLNLSEKHFTDEKTFYERIRRAKPEVGDLIITREAPMGEICMIPENVECCLGQRMVLLKPDSNKIDRKFLLYAIQSEFVQKQIMKSDKTGSIVSNLRIPDLESLLIPRFGSRFEKAAGELLSDIDSKIELNNLINAKLDAISKTIYDYWFIQFDFPNENGKPYKASGGKMEWNQDLRKEIPKGWNASSIIDVTNWIGGAQPAKSTFKYEDTPGYVRFIQNRDFASDDHLTYIPSSKGNKLCSPYDILIDKYGDAGRTRFGLSGAYNVALSKIEVLIPNATEYIRKFLENEATYTYLHNACMASTRASLNESIMENLNLPIPDDKTLELFENITKPILTLNLNNKVENKHLTSLRNWLLPMLMNGQVKVN